MPNGSLQYRAPNCAAAVRVQPVMGRGADAHRRRLFGGRRIGAGQTVRQVNDFGRHHAVSIPQYSQSSAW